MNPNQTNNNVMLSKRQHVKFPLLVQIGPSIAQSDEMDMSLSNSHIKLIMVLCALIALSRFSKLTVKKSKLRLIDVCVV